MRQFNIALMRLQEHCPLAEPFVIKKLKYENNRLGYFTREKDYFKIEIAIDVDIIIQVDSLIHEWAHCLRAVKSPHGFHDGLYGIEWARCYRAVHANTSEDDDIRATMPFGVRVIIIPAVEKYGIPELVVDLTPCP